MSDLIQTLRDLASLYAEEDPNTPIDEFTVTQAANEIEKLQQHLAEAEELKADFKKAMKLFEDTGLDNLLWTLLDTITKEE